MLKKTVRIPIYFGKLVIIVTDDFKDVNKAYKRDIDENGYSAVVFEEKEQDEYVVALKKVEWSVIAHEVVHLVNYIYLRCGIELDRENDEPQAYLTGWIINEIDKFLKTKK